MLSIYIHWPFCLSKCPYCDFNSRVAGEQDQEVWRRAYRRELEAYAAKTSHRKVRTIFFGGGTPSLMEARTVESVLNAIVRLWSVDTGVEITLEANPTSSDAKKFGDFKNAGINRLSLGVQSFNDDALAFLGRGHNAAEAFQAVEIAARIFPRFSFDMIYGYAGHTTERWRAEVKEALALCADHLSLYQLTLEPHTVFQARAGRGETLTAPDDAMEALFDLTQEETAAAGIPAYEISNHARPGKECQHNLTYWHYEDYLGIGPGAHGRCCRDGRRYATENIKDPLPWINKVQAEGCGVAVEEVLDEDTAMSEALLMGLRLTEGLDKQRWNKKFKRPLEVFLGEEKRLRVCQEGLMVEDARTLRATPEGLKRLNALLRYLVSP